MENAAEYGTLPGEGTSSFDLDFVAGTIERTRMPTFERILWRVLRGNLYMNYSGQSGDLDSGDYADEQKSKSHSSTPSPLKKPTRTCSSSLRTDLNFSPRSAKWPIRWEAPCSTLILRKTSEPMLYERFPPGLKMSIRFSTTWLKPDESSLAGSRKAWKPGRMPSEGKRRSTRPSTFSATTKAERPW